ncbi:MAG: amidohydrolase [Vicinamibacterales bacterium]
MNSRLSRTADASQARVPLCLPATCLLATCLLASGLGCGRSQPAPEPDMVLLGGKIVTVDSAFSYAEAVAIRDGKFQAVGTTATVKALAGPHTETVDLHGLTVVPGLMDNHLHNSGGGPGVDLSRARSLADVLAAVGARVAATPAGGVVVSNADWHEAQLREQRLPLRRDLDTVSPDTPVVLVRGGHEYILNTAALKKWHIDRRTPEPDGGRITRGEDGELNGELVDRAKALVSLAPPPVRSAEEQLQDQIAEYRTLNEAGLTSVRHPGTSVAQYRLIRELRKRGLLTMRANVLMRPDRELDVGKFTSSLADAGVTPDEGDEWVRIGGVKLGVDGGFEGGLMRDAYEEPWGQHGEFFGLQTMPRDRYIDIVKALNRLGWRVATHAVGDAAMDLVLDAYDAANAERSIAGRRWSLEHGFIARPDHFRRLKALDVLVAAQDHLYLAGPSLVKYWGPERAALTTPLRSYIDAGVGVSSGTDSSVVPYPPLWTFYHFVTRRTIAGTVLGPEQRITREEALRLATIDNAYLTFEEGTKGSIEPGKLADLVVLSDDIMTCPDGRLEQTTALMTMVGGTIVFERDGFRAGGAR